MLAMQMGAPNSPQWFNTGLHWAYGIDGPSQGHYYVDHVTGEVKASESAYEHPQPHACFIQSIDDDLVNEGGIMDLWVREARLFKYGSGTGTNFSRLRGENEPLSGGGKSSGLMSFLKIGDRAAGAIKSGGTTRRAAKMVVVDIDHPDIEDYINWKVNEEHKVAALVTGSKILAERLNAILKACVNCEGNGDDCFDPKCNPALKREVKAARKAKVPDNAIRRVIQFARQGYTSIKFPVYDTDWDSEAYRTVSGQNSNNSVRVTDDFLRTVEKDGDWNLTYRKTGKVAKTVKARGLWEQIGYAAWACADPGIQFHTTINDWHTCPAAGEIKASNPCSEYMFLDDTACNLASVNLMAFRKADGSFDIEAYEHAIKLWTVVLEIAVTMAQFPSRRIAQLSYEYRTLGLGYANIGGLLMASGIPYDSAAGRALCGALTAIMTGVSYATSAEMARELRPFPGYAANREAMLRVMRNHARAARGEKDGYEGLATAPVPLDHASCPDPRLLAHAVHAFERALELGKLHGYRNAQATVIAPTGTIGLVMDCDTTGIEPDFALVKFKKLAGGGYFKIINRMVPEALRGLGYPEDAIKRIIEYAVGRGTLAGAPGVNHETLAAKGFTPEKTRRGRKGRGVSLRHQIRVQQMDAGRGLPHRHARPVAGADGSDRFRPLGRDWLWQARNRDGQRVCLWRHDARRRARAQSGPSAGVRLRLAVRPQGQALPLGREPYPHDGGGAAVHLRRHLQDHQHAERRERRGLQGGLSAFLAARAQSQRALSRRLEVVAAAQRAAARRRGGRARRGARRHRLRSAASAARHRRRRAHRRTRDRADTRPRRSRTLA